MSRTRRTQQIWIVLLEALMAALPKLTDEEARYLTRDELLRRYRDLECGYLRVASDRGSMMKDLNQRMQIHLTEIRGLKDVNQRLQDDNQELRDLCCFLDDDRRKAMKLAREWQRFGRYTSSVMRSELAAYQHKLQELEKQQEGLVRDNFELKELCLFLDRERETDPSSAGRAEGDGSSNSSGAPDKLLSEERGLGFEVVDSPVTPARDLYSELISSLRSPDTSPLAPPSDNSSDQPTPLKFFSTPSLGVNNASNERSPLTPMTSLPTLRPPSPLQATYAVTNAKKVLQVHEELEQNSATDDSFSEEISDVEKAIVREMCNVVWRKLGDTKPGNNTLV